jgi:hypothetical protein
MWAKRAVWGTIATTVAGLLVMVPGTANAAVGTRVQISSRKLAPGLTYKRISDPAGPWLVYVLTVNPRKAVTLDTVMAGAQMGAWTRTSTMAANAGALAAVNGDFGVWPGFPAHPFADDGILKTTGLRSGVSFGMRRDKTQAYIEHEAVSIWAKDLTIKKGVGVAAWNQQAPGTNQVTGFTSYGGTKRHPPSNACSVRLKMASPLHWGKDRLGVYRDYKVGARRCTSAAMTVGSGSIVLSSKESGAGATWIKSLMRRHTVRLTWDIGMSGVMDTLGGNPLLIDNGKFNVKSTCHTWFCQNNPRTALGVTATGKVLMVVVDGRRSNSVGMTLYGLAKYMASLGAVYAMNLDGGGSATMWIKGMGVVNNPTDSSGERSVSNALVVLPGGDKDEPSPRKFSARARFTRRVTTSTRATWSGRTTMSTTGSHRAMRLALGDPGSTGGLAQWLVGGSDGRMQTMLPRAWLRMAARFRSLR